MIRTKTIEYKDNSHIFQGKISWDDSISERRPGVLVVHAYGGQSKFEENKTVALAKLGYVGFALDMYGKGVRAQTPEEAQNLMNGLDSNRPLLLQRIRKAVDTLREHEQVDKSRISAIGFCFGGKCVLDLARSGTAINGVVSFHGIYDRPNIEYKESIKTAILVLHGWDDPLSTPDQTVRLAQELTSRNADWQILTFGHTGHAFTNPKAKSPEQGLLYNATSDRRAWSAMTAFLKEIFT